MQKHVVIIGNGISGVTTARYLRKQSDCRITIISSETKYFFSRTALMYIYMGHMKFEDTKPYEDHFWEKNNIELLHGHVNEIDFDHKTLNIDANEPVKYDQLVLALGSKPNKFGWKGQDLPGVQGLYSFQDLQKLEENTKKGLNRAVIIGGGLIGVELAEMLHSRNYPVTFLVRESSFWGNVLPKQQADMIARHMTDDYHIDLKLGYELAEIKAGESGRVNSIITKSGEEIDCELVGLTAGVSPNIDFLKSSTLGTDRGIIVNEFLQTNMPDVYAIGDCAQFKQHPKSDRRNIEQVWYTGKMMGMTLAKTLSGKPTKYNPGHWFNSAKFFDIEYQTYGWVFPTLKDNESFFYWENKAKKLSLYVVFDKKTKTFIGLNTFGIRLRHELFDNWLTEGRSVDFVIENLKNANFDPEFYASYDQEIISAYNKQFGKTLQLKRKSWKSIFNLSN